MATALAAWVDNDSDDGLVPEEGTRCALADCDAVVGLWDHDVDTEYGPRAVMDLRPFVAARMSDDPEWVRLCEDCAYWLVQVAPAVDAALGGPARVLP